MPRQEQGQLDLPLSSYPLVIRSRAGCRGCRVHCHIIKISYFIQIGNARPAAAAAVSLENCKVKPSQRRGMRPDRP